MYLRDNICFSQHEPQSKAHTLQEEWKIRGEGMNSTRKLSSIDYRKKAQGVR